jgi:two-component system, sensor histidine kinase RpfC
LEGIGRYTRCVVKARKILLVENHPDVVRLFTMILEALEHHVTAVGSIKEARLALAVGEFDLLLCDYHVNDGNAIELMIGLKASGSKLKSICVSGVGGEIQEKCRQAGFDAFSRKPVSFDEIESAIASLWPGEAVELI